MISIIIPTYNGEKYLPSLLKSLSEQTIKKFELIIVDSSSEDKTVDIAKKYTDQIIIIPKNEFDHGGTRTKAAKFAKGDILVYLTQDVILYNKSALEKLISPLISNNTIGVSFGRQIPHMNANLFARHLRFFNYPDFSYMYSLQDKKKYGLKTIFCSNSFSAYKKRVLEEIGFFKNGLIMGEDMYATALILKKGYKIAYVADAIVYHSHNYTNFQEFKRYFDIGVFHKTENWILNEFGKAENRGLKFILSEINYLIKNNFLLIPESVIRNILKFLGYKLGYYYNSLPIWLIKKLSFHKKWWQKN